MAPLCMVPGACVTALKRALHYSILRSKMFCVSGAIAQMRCVKSAVTESEVEGIVMRIYFISCFTNGIVVHSFSIQRIFFAYNSYFIKSDQSISAVFKALFNVASISDYDG
jgi:hypothetical protein